MFTWEEFKEDKVAVHCKTEEQAKEFCKMMHEQGLEWYSGTSYLDYTHWGVSTENTCYVLGKYSHYEYYSKQGYKIYEFEEIGGKNMEFTKDDLKDGMILEYNSGTRVLNMAGNFYTPPTGFDTSTRSFFGTKFDAGIENFQDDLRIKRIIEEDRTIKKVYTVKKDFVGNMIDMFKDKNLDLIWERQESVKLDAFEKEYLNRLLKGGFKLLARDKDGRLFVFEKVCMKSKEESQWVSDNDFFKKIGKELDTFEFIKWTDEKPTDIKELLKEAE